MVIRNIIHVDFSSFLSDSRGKRDLQVCDSWAVGGKTFTYTFKSITWNYETAETHSAILFWCVGLKMLNLLQLYFLGSTE